MKLTTDQIQYVAKLANLNLTSDEETQFQTQLSSILDYIDQLNTVDTADVEPTFNVSGQTQAMRSDEVKPSLATEDALANSRSVSDQYFTSKGVFEE